MSCGGHYFDCPEFSVFMAIVKEIMIWRPFDSDIGRWFFENELWIKEFKKNA